MSYGIEGIGIVTTSGAFNSKNFQELSNNNENHYADISKLKEFINPRKLRRIAKMNQAAILAAIMAKEDSELELDVQKTGLLLWSATGPIQTTIKFMKEVISEGDISASPTHFSNSVHNSLAAQISIELELRGPNSTISGEGDLRKTLTPAIPMMFSNDIDYLLVIYCEEYNELDSKSEVDGVIAFLLSREKGQHGYFTPDKSINSTKIYNKMKRPELFDYGFSKFKS